MWKLQRLAYLHLCGFIVVVDEKSFEDSKRKFMGGDLACGQCALSPTADMRRVPASKHSKQTDRNVDKSCLDC